MKKLVLILFVSISFIAGAFAQSFEKNPKVKEARKKFFNQELLFTDAENKAFWPIFDRYQQELRSLNKKYKSKGSITNDQDGENQIQRSLEYDQKKVELKKKYIDQFSKVLPVKKVAMIESTEKKFRRKVLKRVRKNRNQRN